MRTVELQKLEKQEKKQANTSGIKRAENILRSELRELLDEYLNQRRCESITIEVKEIDVVDLQAIIQTDLPEYECEQVSETLYKFTVKMIDW